MAEIALPNQPLIEAFWIDARLHAGLNQLAAYCGPTPLDSLQPPAWALGASAEDADELAQLVVDGTKTATSSSLWDYEGEGEPLPVVGGLDIVLDGSGCPRALIATTSVTVKCFLDVGAKHAHAEGEGDRSLGHWRAVHEDFFTTHAAPGRPFSPSMPVVCQTFDVLYRR